MQHRFAWTLCAIVILCLFARLAPGQRSLAVGYRAVVDIEKLRREHRRYRAMIEDLEKDRQAVAARDAELQSEIDALVAECETLAPLSEEAQRLSIEIIKREGHAQFLRELSSEELRRRHEKIDFQLSKEIEAAIQHFALKHRIDIVLNAPKPKLDDELALDDAKALFDVDVVFYNNIDITLDILNVVGR